MFKKELRKIYLQKRALLNREEVNIFSKKILENVQHNFQFLKGENMHIFISIDAQKEVDTKNFIDFFFAEGLNVFVPKIFGNELRCVQITTHTQYITNSWGIAEPVDSPSKAKVDFNYAIVPLLYCDAKGNRIGYGKGFYDRFFASANPNMKKIGVCFFLPDELIDDVSVYDIPLNYLVTPSDVLSFAVETDS